MMQFFDELLSALAGLPSQRRIRRWREWIERDGWTRAEIDEFCPIAEHIQ